ncbi:MAG: hypothetical protein KKB22_03760 [Candidatus Omnitrophica bacterium]|nr:hypothetical protein [Candidatus Omnitrophota bacterium]
MKIFWKFDIKASAIRAGTVFRQLWQAFEKTLGRPSMASFAHCFFSLVTMPIRHRDTMPAQKSDAFLKPARAGGTSQILRFTQDRPDPEENIQWKPDSHHNDGSRASINLFILYNTAILCYNLCSII